MELRVSHALAPHCDTCLEGGVHLHLALAGDGRRVRLDGLGNAEVDELQLPLHHEEVGGLEIRVHDARLMDRVDRLPVSALRVVGLSGSVGYGITAIRDG